MHRRFSTLVKGSTSSLATHVEKEIDDDGDSKLTVVKEERAEPLPIPSLKVKRVDYYYSRWGKAYKYRNTSAKVTVESLPIMQHATNDQWKEFSFVIVRTIPRVENAEPTFKIVVKSEYILKACKEVIQTWPGISWNSDPLELDPQIFITFRDEFADYARKLEHKKRSTEEEAHTLTSVRLLNSTIAADFRNTLATLKRLCDHGEIQFDLLQHILVPRSIIVTRCAATGLPRLFQLISRTYFNLEGKPVYQLTLESVDLVDRPMTHSVVVGRIQTVVNIRYFKGIVKIDSLDAYPLKFHADSEGLKKMIVARGRKWKSMIGIHHKQYDGIAALKCGDKVLRHNVRSRIMVDRATFRRLNPNYAVPTPVPPKAEGSDVPGMNGLLNNGMPLNTSNPIMQYDQYGNTIPQPVPSNTASNIVHIQSADDTAEVELTEPDLLLTPTTVFAFSLGDKMWLEFSVDKVEDVDWNEDAFANLVLPDGRKDLLRSLVEAHHKEIGIDDFIKGKGHGLVVNLFGPTGVGKTFSAEATSEHVRRPLYIIGGGDLGTTAASLDSKLEQIFDVATAWKAIVLIDEADVFLEQRSLHDLERNAMVAVFLRHVEYYRGILFLTTNRVKAFDEAFLSRIHVALHFRDLSRESKRTVWTAFLDKAGAKFSETQMSQLSQRDINGRQIKNTVRTAHSLAAARGEELQYHHLLQTLDALDEFSRDLAERTDL